MKKVIALFMILAVLLSSVSCKKKTNDEIGYVDFEQKYEQQPQPEASAPQQEQAEEQKQEPEPDPEIPTLSDPDDEDDGETELPTFVPKDVYTAEYLPEKLGYVKKQTNNGKTFYYNAVKDFEIREPITEQMIDASKKYGQHPYFDYNGWEQFKTTVAEYPIVMASNYNEGYIPGCYVRQEDPNGDWFGFPERYDTDLDYFESWLQDDTFIVKGHFEDSYGDSYARYSVDSNYKFGFNYEIDPYTVHNFVIDKVYTENCGYKAGDVVEVGLGGTIMQNYDGFYCSVLTGRYMTSHQEYVSFKGKTLEERTFILSLKPPLVQDRPDFLTVDLLSHNAYDTETVYKFSNRAYGPESVSAKEILEKYN